MSSKVERPSLGRRPKRTWQHALIKMTVLGLMMLLLCLLFAKNGGEPIFKQSIPDFALQDQSTSRITLESEPKDDGNDDEGGCDLLHQQNATTLCSYINTPGNCDDVNPFVDFYYCGKSSHIKPLSWIAFLLLLLLLFYLIGIATDEFFTPTLEVLGVALKMSPEVAGLTILALGNGAPDLATSISSIVLAKPFDIVVGGLFGAALFVSSIVVAAVSFIGRHVKLDAPNTIRDIAFYLVAVVGVFFITWDGEIYIYEAVIFLVYYFGYVAFACITHYCGFCKPQREEENTITKSVASTSINANPDYDRLSDPDDGLLGGVHSRDNSYGSISDKARLLDSGEMKTGDDSDDEDDETPFSFRLWWAWFLSKSLLKRIYIAISSLVILPMYLSVPTIKWNRYNHAISLPGSIVVLYLALGYLPVLTTERKYWISFTVCMVIATALAIVMFFTTKRDQPPKYKPVFVLLSFVISIAWIAMIADELVSVLQAMGVILGVPTFVLGATVLAWGNSVPDLVADIVMAQKGFPGSALSAAWGGPMLNMLIGMGIGFCIRCAVLFPNPVVVEASKSFLAAGGFLFVILYGTLIVLWIRKFTLDWWLGAALVVIYLLFNLFTGLIEGKVMWKGPVPV